MTAEADIIRLEEKVRSLERKLRDLKRTLAIIIDKLDSWEDEELEWVVDLTETGVEEEDLLSPFFYVL